MSDAILLLLAVVFAAAGASKLMSPDPFRNTLRKLAPKRLVPAAALAIPLFELALAAWLLSGVAPRQAAGVAIVVLLAFTAVLLRMWRRGLSGCGCFGEAADSAPSGIARNVILIALGLAAALPTGVLHGPWSGGAGTVAGRLTLILGAACLWPCAIALVRLRDPAHQKAGTSRREAAAPSRLPGAAPSAA